MSRIVLWTGGTTPEREVALAGAAQVLPVLRELGHEVRVLDTALGPLDEAGEAKLLEAQVGLEPPSPETLRQLREGEDFSRWVREEPTRSADLVFLILHGAKGEGGAVQGLLELADKRYTGSDLLGSALAMDKSFSKRLLRERGLPQADWLELELASGSLPEPGGVPWNLPWVVKPARGGSSVGVSIVHDVEDWPSALERAAAEDSKVLVERWLPGREFTVGILGDRALGVGEILPAHEFFDYACKYSPALCREVFPAEISAELTLKLQHLALETHRALGLRDFSRIDFRLDAEGQPCVLEANTLPGLTQTSLLPQSAKVCGLDFRALCQAIVEMALRR
jgi:D-alanine-D-alanine ligase